MLAVKYLKNAYVNINAILNIFMWTFPFKGVLHMW